MNPLSDALVAPLAEREEPVLILPDSPNLTGKTLFEMSGRFANVLAGYGVRPGDRVAMQAEKSPHALALYLACLRTGALFLPLNTAYTPAELDYFFSDAEPRIAVCDPNCEAQLAPTAWAKGVNLLTLGPSGEGNLSETAQSAMPEFHDIKRSENDLAAILYTSGTTGLSKGAMLSHGNLLTNADTLVDAWKFNLGDTLLHALPIFHVHGLFVATNVLLRVGGRMIFLPKFDLDLVIAYLPQTTTMMGVPTYYTRLLDDPRFDRDLVAGMRLFISGSAPLLPDTHRRFEARTGHVILERYGMTETTMSTSNPYDGERRAGSVGLPLPHVEARITDPKTGMTVGEGETGILEVRGPNVFKGYWRMPEKTAEEFRSDGYFITGDLARIDADGYVNIMGRAKDLLITGGYNVYPKEVEMVIDSIEGVLESAIIGAPHPDFGEGVVAVVVRSPGSKVTPQFIMESLTDRLARFKQPKRIFFENRLPRNAMGKVQKNTLRDTYGSAFSDPAGAETAV